MKLILPFQNTFKHHNQIEPKMMMMSRQKVTSLNVEKLLKGGGLMEFTGDAT